MWHTSNAQFGEDENMINVEKLYMAGGTSIEQMIQKMPAIRDRLAPCPPKSNEMRPIIIDGRVIQVGINLENAFRALREVSRDKEWHGILDRCFVH